jgi:hypothetical protein
MKENTNSTKSLIEIDHVGFGDDLGGYHTKVHLTQQLSDPPAPTSSVSVIYAKQINQINPDEALFFLSGGNRLAQLTMNIAPVLSSTNGITYLPGGILVQYGKATTTSGLAIVVFTQPFTTIFTALATAESLLAGVIVNTLSLVPTQLSLQLVDFNGNIVDRDVNWMAIGSV